KIDMKRLGLAGRKDHHGHALEGQHWPGSVRAHAEYSRRSAQHWHLQLRERLGYLRRPGQMTKIAYRRLAVDSIEIFYRQAGRSNAPALLLLHGFPTASHMFRDLIPQLADRFHVIAPD